jgi:hypothetical protein
MAVQTDVILVGIPSLIFAKVQIKNNNSNDNTNFFHFSFFTLQRYEAYYGVANIISGNSSSE